MLNCLINLKQEHLILQGIVLGTAIDYMNEVLTTYNNKLRTVRSMEPNAC
jgi:hypothetical protein